MYVIPNPPPPSLFHGKNRRPKTLALYSPCKTNKLTVASLDGSHISAEIGGAPAGARGGALNRRIHHHVQAQVHVRREAGDGGVAAFK